MTCKLVITCWERADLLALLGMVLSCVSVTFQWCPGFCVVLGSINSLSLHSSFLFFTSKVLVDIFTLFCDCMKTLIVYSSGVLYYGLCFCRQIFYSEYGIEYALKHGRNTPDRWQSKTLILSTNVDQRLLET